MKHSDEQRVVSFWDTSHYVAPAGLQGVQTVKFDNTDL